MSEYSISYELADGYDATVYVATDESYIIKIFKDPHAYENMEHECEIYQLLKEAGHDTIFCGRHSTKNAIVLKRLMSIDDYLYKKRIPGYLAPPRGSDVVSVKSVELQDCPESPNIDITLHSRRVRASLLEKKVRICHNIFVMLARFHNLGIIHGDIKPDNILVDATGATHFIDFGFTFLETRGLHYRHYTDIFQGTDGYRAPELITMTGASSKASDVWAAAMSAIEILSGTMLIDVWDFYDEFTPEFIAGYKQDKTHSSRNSGDETGCVIVNDVSRSNKELGFFKSLVYSFCQFIAKIHNIEIDDVSGDVSEDESGDESEDESGDKISKKASILSERTQKSDTEGSGTERSGTERSGTRQCKSQYKYYNSEYIQLLLMEYFIGPLPQNMKTSLYYIGDQLKNDTVMHAGLEQFFSILEMKLVVNIECDRETNTNTAISTDKDNDTDINTDMDTDTGTDMDTNTTEINEM